MYIVIIIVILLAIIESFRVFATSARSRFDLTRKVCKNKNSPVCNMPVTSVIESSIIIPTDNNKVFKVLFLDWDDTLFPTTYMDNVGDGNHSKKYLKRAMLECEVLLRKLISKSDVIFLITNANYEWLDYSMNLYPTVKKLIYSEPKINIISSYEEHRKKSASSNVWKHLSFVEYYTKWYNSVKNTGVSKIHILSIGDGDPEWNAIESLKNILIDTISADVNVANDVVSDVESAAVVNKPDLHFKRLKMIQEPDLIIMYLEFGIVQNILDDFYNSEMDENIKIVLNTMMKKSGPPNAYLGYKEDIDKIELYNCDRRGNLLNRRR